MYICMFVYMLFICIHVYMHMLQTSVCSRIAVFFFLLELLIVFFPWRRKVLADRDREPPDHPPGAECREGVGEERARIDVKGLGLGFWV